VVAAWNGEHVQRSWLLGGSLEDSGWWLWLGVVWVLDVVWIVEVLLWVWADGIGFLWLASLMEFHGRAIVLDESWV
jgi:hypothetical protein